jgi:hypothetical protein
LLTDSLAVETGANGPLQLMAYGYDAGGRYQLLLVAYRPSLSAADDRVEAAIAGIVELWHTGFAREPGGGLPPSDVEAVPPLPAGTQPPRGGKGENCRTVLVPLLTSQLQNNCTTGTGVIDCTLVSVPTLEMVEQLQCSEE